MARLRDPEGGGAWVAPSEEPEGGTLVEEGLLEEVRLVGSAIEGVWLGWFDRWVVSSVSQEDICKPGGCVAYEHNSRISHPLSLYQIHLVAHVMIIGLVALSG